MMHTKPDGQPWPEYIQREIEEQEAARLHRGIRNGILMSTPIWALLTLATLALLGRL